MTSASDSTNKSWFSLGRRSVTQRVTLSYLVVTFAFSLVAGWNVFALRAATQEAELLRSGYLPLSLALRDIVGDQAIWSTQLNHVTTARNPADTRLWLESALAPGGRPKSFADARAAIDKAFGNQSAELKALGERLSSEATRIEEFLADDRELISRLFDALSVRDVERAQSVRDYLVAHREALLA